MTSAAFDSADRSSGNRPQFSRRAFLADTVVMGGVGGALLGTASAFAAEPKSKGVDMNPRMFSFIGGSAGEWVVVSAQAIAGEPLPAVERLQIVAGVAAELPTSTQWTLRGVTSNARYVTRDEKDHLTKTQAPLGRPEATHAALIPIRKSAKWWDLTQDERREIFEEKSKHNTIGLRYLPAIARRLHHCRDLSDAQPFDFITLFDFAPSEASAFDDLVAALRETEEWKYVDREFDLRLVRAQS